jgi:hypothetical protein
MHYKLLSCTKIENLKIYSRSEIMQANVISKAEVMDGKMRLDFAVEMGFEKKIKFYTVCDAFYIKLFKKIIDTEFAKLDFYE